MAKQTFVGQIAAMVEQAKRPSDFSCDGLIEAKVGLEVEDFGAVKLPLRPAAARKLTQVAIQAPYGKRTKTIVDTTVRDTLEIAADKVRFSDAFSEAVQGAAREVAATLQLDEDRLEVDLYKLLIYLKGGFFLPHRDSEKRRGMVATMIVVLPSKFNGGELIIEHSGKRKSCRFDAARSESSAQYAAFFADCRHEIKKVTSGVRVCLAFNLILKPRRARRPDPKSSCDPKLLRAVEDWMRQREKDPMVFALEHQYTASGLTPSQLKGADKQLFEQLAAVAGEADCRLHMGQVSRHLSQFADDGSFGYGRRGSSRWSGNYDDLDIGEVFEDEIVIDGWKDAQGKSTPLGELPCDASELFSATPVEQWVPTQQDYEGYTGNAGNTLDRWYHKSAVVLWSNRAHYDVITQMGLKYAVEQLLAMRKTLVDKDVEELEQACHDCQMLAEAIIRHWPNRLYEHRWEGRDLYPWLADFARELPNFDDPDLIGEFLRTLAQRDWVLKLDKLLPQAIKRMGAEAILPCLEELIRAEIAPNKYGVIPVEGLAERDASWLLKLSQARGGGLDSPTIRRLLDPAIEKLGRHARKQEDKNHYGRDSSLTSTWLLLCQAAISAEGTQQLRQLLQLTVACPKVFDLRSFQVSAAKKLRDWADKHSSERPAALVDWVESLKQYLRDATKAEPTAPNDFTRSADTGCKCRFCEELAEFLRDRQKETTRISAREDCRDHLNRIINSKQLDVSTQLDRSTRPYALQLQKNMDSYHRALKQYESDLELLESLR